MNLADIVWHELPAEAAAARLESDPVGGLTQAEVDVRQRQFGLNQMTARKRLSEWMRFLLQFHQPLIYILLASTAIAAAMGEWVDASVIFGVAFINAVVGYLQEARAEKAIEALAKMVVAEATFSTWRESASVRLLCHGTSSSGPWSRSIALRRSAADSSSAAVNTPARFALLVAVFVG